MSGSLLILAFFGAGVGLARLGLIPRYFMEHDVTLYVLWLLMLLVGLSIGADRRLGEILRTLRPRVLLLPLATTVGTFAGVAAASFFLAYSLADCLAVGAGFAYYSLSSIFITQYKGAGNRGPAQQYFARNTDPGGHAAAGAPAGAAGPHFLRRGLHYGYHPARHRPLRGPGVDFHLHCARHDSGFQRALLGHSFLQSVTGRRPL